MLLFFSSFFLCYFDIVFIAIKILLLPCPSLYNITIVLKRREKYLSSFMTNIAAAMYIASTIIYCFYNTLLKPDRIKIKGTIPLSTTTRIKTSQSCVISNSIRSTIPLSTTTRIKTSFYFLFPIEGSHVRYHCPLQQGLRPSGF